MWKMAAKKVKRRRCHVANRTLLGPQFGRNEDRALEKLREVINAKSGEATTSVSYG